jgi:hypothetical protein
METL